MSRQSAVGNVSGECSVVSDAGAEETANKEMMMGWVRKMSRITERTSE